MRHSKRPDLPDSRSLLTPGKAFARWDPIVSTTLFHWFTPTTGNLLGAWLPLGGRDAWTGEKAWWMIQIRQIMMANIDVLYVHLIEQFEEQRINFFAALSELRSQGYDVPKIAPFLDPFAIWPPRDEHPDMALDKDKDEFARHYIRFFEQYFHENRDPLAATYLAQIDGRIVLVCWWVSYILENIHALTRTDLESRLSAALADRCPGFRNGIYMVSTALVDPDLTFSDERAVFFSGYTYCIQSVHNGTHVYHIQPGYWDQNLRTPGYLMRRTGGLPYKGAWDYVLYQCTPVHRIYIESWNEYDEGSGIYPAEPGEPMVTRTELTGLDRWSSIDNPFEYIRTTAAGAAVFNRLPLYDARILFHNLPRKARTGQRLQVSVVVRNEGNASWTVASPIALYVENDAAPFPRHKFSLANIQPAIDSLGEVFRGCPIRFDFTFSAPWTKRSFNVTLGMARGAGERFGEQLQIKLEVV